MELPEGLRRLGFRSQASLSMADSRELSELSGLPLSEVEWLIEGARSSLPGGRLRLEPAGGRRLSTGCKALDDMLGGGVETGAITELVGEFGTGKTQLCHQLCVTVQLSEDLGGLSAKAAYLDSEGTFAPERVVQMARRWGLDPSEALRGVYYARLRSVAEQVASLLELRRLVEEGVILAVVDSIAAHFRGPAGPDALTRAHELAVYLSSLRELAEEQGVAVVVTDRVSAAPGLAELRPSADPIAAMFVDYRVSLHKVRENVRRAQLEFAPWPARRSALFAITEDGVVDV